MHRFLCPLLLACLTLTASLALAAEADTGWSHWRGPQGTGLAPAADPPMAWSETKNIRWKVAIPGAGHASPIVLGDRLYLSTAIKTDRLPDGVEEVEVRTETEVDAGGPHMQDGRGRGEGRRGRGRGRGRGRPEPPKNIFEFAVIALDRNTGKSVWQTTVCEEKPHEGIHGTGSFASISPVTDGTHLYASFGSRGIYCLDLDGNVKWKTDLGDMSIRATFGEGGSPAIHDGVLVIPWDHEEDSFIIALDAATGKERWRKSRDERTSWTSPIITEVGGKSQAIFAGTSASIGYDLATGAEIWRCTGMTGNVVPTPIIAHGMVYLISGFRGAAIQAVKLDAAKGDITGTDAIAWSHDKATPYIPSALLSGRNLYFLKGTGGIISCLDAVDGTVHFDSERLDIGNIYASIVGAAGRVYIFDREGTTLVLKDGPSLEVLATNTIDEGINATPAIVGDTMYIRGSNHLYCVARTGAGMDETGAE